MNTFNSRVQKHIERLGEVSDAFARREIKRAINEAGVIVTTSREKSDKVKWLVSAYDSESDDDYSKEFPLLQLMDEAFARHEDDAQKSASLIRQLEALVGRLKAHARRAQAPAPVDSVKT